MSRKKKIVCVLILMAACFVSYRLGKGTGSEKKEETQEEGEAFFGEHSTVFALSEGGVRCDYSVSPAPYALTRLADALVEEVENQDGIREAAAFYMRREGSRVFYGMEGLSGGVYGVGTDFLEASGLMIEEGRGISQEDVETGACAAVLNDRAASRLFGGGEALGKFLEIEGRLFQVVGIAGTRGGQKEELVLVPESVWPELYQYEEPKAVVVCTDQDTREAKEHVKRVLNSVIPKEITARYEVQQ